jgi:hypothetical protein
MVSTSIQQCVEGTTNSGTGNTDVASCSICLPGVLGCGANKLEAHEPHLLHGKGRKGFALCDLV